MKQDCCRQGNLLKLSPVIPEKKEASTFIQRKSRHYLEELLAKLCPDGVEYRALKDIGEIKRGTPLTRKDSVKGIYPVISGGKEPAFYCNTYNRKGEIITIAGSGVGAGYVQYWNTPVFVCDAFSMKVREDYSTKYIFYYLKKIQQKIYRKRTGGGVPHVYISSIENFIIPLPPLDIQKEIVKILDTFTELNTELNTRKQQYQYYRDKLLDFSGRGDVEWKPLGEIGKVSMCKRIMKEETSIVGDVPFYKIGSFGGTPNAYISREIFEKYKAAYSYPKKGDILISVAGTIGKTVIFDGEPAYFQDSNIVWVENDESIVLNKFLFFYYQLQPWSASNGGIIARLYNDNIKRTKIPIPPLAEQKRIIRILDRFNALYNDLTSGLPAEIAARKKQYAYYRDKLLCFDKVVS